MASFKEFVDSEKNSPKSLINEKSTKALATSIGGTLIASSVISSPSESDKFGKEVTELACSDEVLNELSESIGRPEDWESEDEFVDRAKSTLANILRKKLVK